MIYTDQNMIRKLLGTVGICLLTISTSFAKLGGNRAQSIARYGYPINMIASNILVFRTKKFNVVQYFNSLDFVEAIGYQKLAGAISEDDMNAIRTGNHLPAQVVGQSLLATFHTSGIGGQMTGYGSGFH